MPSAAKLTDLAALYRQLAALTSAGISPTSAAGVIASAQMTSGLAATSGGILTRRAMETIKQRTWQGMRLSQAMSEWPQIFPPFHLAIITQSEATGQIDNALTRLAEVTEKDLALHQDLRKQTFYPSVVFFFGVPVLIVAFLTQSISLVPWFAAILMVLIFLLIRTAGFAIGGIQGQANPGAMRFAMKVPIIGGIARRISISHFMRAFGLLSGAGVPIVPSLLYAADASGNQWVVDPIRRIVPRIEAGAPLRETLASTGIFPPDALAMISTGEMTGSLDAQLQRSALYYEAEAERQMRTFCMILGVVILIVVGGLTGYIGIVFWKRYYENMINNPFGAHVAP